MTSQGSEVAIGREHHELMPDADLREEDIDRPDLYTVSAADVPQFRRRHVVLPVGNDEGKDCESFEDQLSRLGALKSLQQLLENQTGGEQRLVSFDRVTQSGDGRFHADLVAPQRERPDAAVDEQRQSRERSAL